MGNKPYTTFVAETQGKVSSDHVTTDTRHELHGYGVQEREYKERKEGETFIPDKDEIDIDIKNNGDKHVLLLGTESSGKSTLIKQIKSIKGDLETDQFVESRHNIRENIVSSIIKLYQESQKLYTNNIINKYVNLEDTKLSEAVKCVTSFKHKLFKFDEEINWNQIQKLAKSLEILWNLKAIQLAFHQRSRFEFPDNMDYFFQKVTKIFMKNYYPTHEDVLRARLRANGMDKYSFYPTPHDVSHKIHIYDVPQQKHQCIKWIDSVENVTAIIFVASLNDYNRILFQDEHKNALHESMYLFDEIINSKSFKQTEIILLFNKKDLFINSLRAGIPLSVCFNTKYGWNGRQWKERDNVNDYKPSLRFDAETDNKLFQKSYETAINFIQNIYVSFDKNKYAKRRILAHVMDAINDHNIQQDIFWDIQSILIRSNLSKRGLI